MVVKTISDDELLTMIEQHEIVVDLYEATVYRNNKLKIPTIVGVEHLNGTRYRYEFRSQTNGNRRKRSILRSRLVYMAGTMKVIPDGFEIHHVDGDRNNDAFHNLILVSISDHLKLHHKFKYKTPF